MYEAARMNVPEKDDSSGRRNCLVKKNLLSKKSKNRQKLIDKL